MNSRWRVSIFATKMNILAAFLGGLGALVLERWNRVGQANIPKTQVKCQETILNKTLFWDGGYVQFGTFLSDLCTFVSGENSKKETEQPPSAENIFSGDFSAIDR